MIERDELEPGSREPSDPAEVDHLLSFVPELSFLDAFADCVPALPPSPPTHAEVDAYFEGESLATVVAALRSVGGEAERTDNGGIAFLVRTMLHFIEAQPVPASQHPLLVALYLRGAARASGTAETSRAIANAMDRWD